MEFSHAAGVSGAPVALDIEQRPWWVSGRTPCARRSALCDFNSTILQFYNSYLTSSAQTGFFIKKAFRNFFSNYLSQN